VVLKNKFFWDVHMVFVGMDHGTTGVSFTILYDNPVHFKIGREELSKGEISAIDELAARVDLNSIELMAITYAMGDGISYLESIKEVKDKGILSINGAGKVTGGGTAVYTQIEESGIPTVLIPGLHKNSHSLDPRFRAAYSHMASPEKVSICYNALVETGFKNFIVSDISSNTVTILIEQGKIVGAIDACLGSMGVIHGPLDLQMLRDVDDGVKTANECFSRAGAVKVANINENVTSAKEVLLKKYENRDPDAILALETMLMTIEMEIKGLYGIAKNKIEGVVLTGSMGSMREPFDFYGNLKTKVDKIGEVVRLPPTSGSIGSAQIARSVYEGANDILGIGIKF
jgi:putative methanogenesis marker protein 12